MKIQYKSFANESDVEFKWGRSLDTMFEPGSYTIEIDNIDEDIGLPDEICSDEHYIVGNLVVTDSGTKGHRQDNRVIGQILTFTSRESKETKYIPVLLPMVSGANGPLLPLQIYLIISPLPTNLFLRWLGWWTLQRSCRQGL